MEKTENEIIDTKDNEVFDIQNKEYIRFMKSMTIWESLKFLLNRKIDKNEPNYRNQFEKEGESGLDRIRVMWTEYMNGEDNPEMRFIGNSTGYGCLVGAVYGGIVSNRTSVADFVRRHNESVFRGEFEAKRLIQDSMVLQFGRGGFRWGWRVGLFTCLMSSMTSTSIAYRNDVYFSDCMIATSLLCGLWKVKLGLRAVVVSGVVGSILGLLFAGNLKLILWAMNTTVPEYRYWRQNRYLGHMIVEEYSDGTTEYEWAVDQKKHDSSSTQNQELS